MIQKWINQVSFLLEKKQLYKRIAETQDPWKNVICLVFSRILILNRFPKYPEEKLMEYHFQKTWRQKWSE